MKKLLLLIILVSGINAFGQTIDTIVPRPLPFHIDESKKIPHFEIEDKKEGTFLTGLPRFEFDPIRGFGVGGNVNLYLNNTKEDPFFEYTPYRHKVNAEFFIFENGRTRWAFNYDAPYIFDTKWRVRADFIVWEDPEAQYWGVGSSTLNPLQFRDKRTGNVRRFNKINRYEENLSLAEQGPDGRMFTHHNYNNMLQEEVLTNLLLERTFLGGRLRAMFGYEMLFTNFQSYGGQITDEAIDPITGNHISAVNYPTLVEQQKADGTWDRFNLSGFTNDDRMQFTSMLAWALIYDTRDFEPDPSQGVFLQYSHEYSSPFLGSDFNFHKFMLQGQYIHTFHRWNNNRSRLTFAGLGAFGHIFGSDINFIEMWDLSSQAEAGGIMVMGGERSLRGYREARFLAPTTALINLELRSRFHEFHLWRQHFTLGATIFYDAGTVWNSPSEMTLKRWKGSPGAGARVAWNQSTIIRLDYARSREGSQVFFGLGHIF